MVEAVDKRSVTTLPWTYSTFEWF